MHGSQLLGTSRQAAPLEVEAGRGREAARALRWWWLTSCSPYLPSYRALHYSLPTSSLTSRRRPAVRRLVAACKARPLTVH